MSRLLCAAAAFALFLGPFGLNASAAEASSESTLVPQTVYVGDRARLIVPLDAAAFPEGRDSLVADRAEALPKSGAVHIHRVEVERRQGRVRALIDFTAFAPGTVQIPPIDIEGIRLRGLEIHIASVLDGGSADLSPPEKTLVAPGTYALIYGGISLLAAAVVSILLMALRGVPAYREYAERRKRGLAARSMRRVLGRLEAEGGTMDCGMLLSVLFEELRSYLTYRTGYNCHALTAREFPTALAETALGPRFSETDLAFLESLFRLGDEVRFGSRSATRPELLDALNGVGDLIDRTEAALC